MPDTDTNPFITTAEAVFVAVRYGMPTPTTIEAPTDTLPTRLRVPWGDEFDQWADYLNAEVSIVEADTGATTFATAVGRITPDIQIMVTAWHIADPDVETGDGLAAATDTKDDSDAS